MPTLVLTNADHRQEFDASFAEVDTDAGIENRPVLFQGIGPTLIPTVGSFLASVPLRLMLRLGRRADSTPSRKVPDRLWQTVARTTSTPYNEVVRRIPMLGFTSSSPPRSPRTSPTWSGGDPAGDLTYRRRGRRIRGNIGRVAPLGPRPWDHAPTGKRPGDDTSCMNSPICSPNGI